MRKVILFFICIIYSIFSFSCSSQNEEIIKYNSEESLFSVFKNKEQDKLWTRELESVRLLQDTSKIDGALNSVKLNKVVVMSLIDKADKKYPYIESFGSLDISSMNNALKTVLDDFSNDLSFGFINETYFSKDSVYSFVLFKNDLQEIWTKLFNQKYLSFTKEEQKDILNDKKTFTKWIYSTPFIYEDEIQVPVRYSKDKKYIDVVILFSNDLKIKLINITKWGSV